MNIYTKVNRGFTLIELLVVIAIIGILASVVLASLNTARDKGSDAAIKANLNSARAQAEIFYDTNNSYLGVCTTGTSNISAMITGANSAGGRSTQCEDDDAPVNGWAANSQLKTSAGWYCIDSTGQATTTSADTITATDDISCAP